VQDSIYHRFLEWYNNRYGKKYLCKKATDYFPDAAVVLAFDFVFVENDVSGKWLALQTGELAITDDTRARFDYWQKLCPELGRDLKAQAVAGEFAVHLPKFTFKPGDVEKFRATFASVLAVRQKMLDMNTFADIGEYMADKFPEWPRLPSLDMIEFHQWGTFGRPAELLIQRAPGATSKLTLLVSPPEVFNFDNGKIRANELLDAAKEKGAVETILLFAGKLTADEDIVKSSLPLLNKDLLSGADEIYLIDTADKVGLAKIV